MSPVYTQGQGPFTRPYSNQKTGEEQGVGLPLVSGSAGTEGGCLQLLGDVAAASCQDYCFGGAVLKLSCPHLPFSLTSGTVDPTVLSSPLIPGLPLKYRKISVCFNPLVQGVC